MTELSSSPDVDPFGRTYYPELVGVSAGVFVGGHWNRKRKQQTDVYVACSCGCNQRLLCREFESHAGRQAAKSWSTSIKIADKTSANLGDWIKRQCHKLGDEFVGQKIRIWLPAKRQKKVAIIKSYSSKDREHLLQYQDGSEEVLYLAVESYTLEGSLLAGPAEPAKGKHSCKGEFDEDASSMSASKRQRFDRMHGQNKSKDMHSMHGAATTLVDLAQTHPKDHGNVAVKHATEPQLAAVGYSDDGLPEHQLSIKWKVLFSNKILRTPANMHEDIRNVLLDLKSFDGRLLPTYLGKCWGFSNTDPVKFIEAIHKRCQQIILNSSADKMETKLLQFFKMSLKLHLPTSSSVGS